MPKGTRGFRFDDDVLAVAGRSQDVQGLIGGNTDFVPNETIINRSTDQGEETAGYATVTGFLIGENETYIKDYRLLTRRPLSIAFARIYSTGTTARGITVLEGN